MAASSLIASEVVTSEPLAAPAAEQPLAGSLQHLFRALIFDWDGTAVANRQTDATALARLLETLLLRQVWIVIVTGTNFGNVDRQFCGKVDPAARRHLLVCANRGSEVYGFDDAGTAVCRWRRDATPAEEAALTAVAEGVRDTLGGATGLEIGIVYDRLNRRKIDLIPLPEWADPPKSRIGDLLKAVERRLHNAGLAGGISEAIQLTERLAREHGLPEARITSDVKHIEVGLTDKGDSVAWIKRHLLEPEGIALQDVLIAGDEFGPIAGFAGSDDRLRGDVDGAVVVSVGPEPNGAPAGVLHLGGGPSQFRALLADQICLRHYATHPTLFTAKRQGWARTALQPPTDPNWRFDAYGYQPAIEHSVESRFAVANGFMGSRGSLAQPTSASRPGAFVAGLFDASATSPAIPALVPAPDWLRYRILLDGKNLNLEEGEIVSHRRVLDLRRGLLLTEWRHCDPNGRTARMRSLRFASLANRAISAQVAQFEVAQAGTVALEAWLEPASDHLVVEHTTPSVTLWRTAHSGQRLALASASTLQVDSRLVPGRVSDHRSRRQWQWSVEAGQPTTFTRIVAAARGNGHDDDEPGAALRALREARASGITQLLVAHPRAWDERWVASDIAITGDDQAQRALRLALYHLISAANPEDEHTSIGARGLTGEAYLGHVFWDTDIFLLPFYTFTWPAAARAMLMYRYHTLPAARRKAERLGYRGALYAWESARDGEETTPPYVLRPDGQVLQVRCGTDEQHISDDVAYAVWQYWLATEDTAFLRDAGAEIVLETARFWGSRATRETDGRYHIRGVIGPDEYHEDVDDNAYTNGMAQWNLERGMEVTHLLQTRWPEQWVDLRERLAITSEELTLWQEVRDGLVTRQDPKPGVIEQFAGFFNLEPIDPSVFANRNVPVDMLLGTERTQRSQVIKQADVVMLLALLWDHYDPATRAANFAYYEPKCAHGSSLSPAMHALVAARLGAVDVAERYFRQTAAIDLDDTMGNAALGVHMAAFGGLWQAATLGFAGMTQSEDGLRFDPHLPESWRTMRFPLQWRGRSLQITLQREPRSFTAEVVDGAPMTVQVGAISHTLSTGQSWSCHWDEREDCWKESSL